MNLDDQISMTRNTLQNAQATVKQRERWVEDAKRDLDYWSSLLESLEDYKKAGY